MRMIDRRARMSSSRAELAISVARIITGLRRATPWKPNSVDLGRLALRLAPRLLEETANGMEIILVSGTNGKTTTTRMVAECLRAMGPTASNDFGANMPAGIVTALATTKSAERAAIEVDERYLPSLASAIRPRVMVLLNLSRDQLDRSPEPRMVAELWRRGLRTGAALVANADDPLITWAALPAAKVIWVAAGQRWHNDSWCCPACGELLVRMSPYWSCPLCGLHRPEPEWIVEGDQISHLPTRRSYLLRLSLPGPENRANAAMALAAAAGAGVPLELALPRLQRLDSVAGRYSSFPYHGKRVRLLLAKNPASWMTMVELLEEDKPLILALNARDIDGRDTSWIWDVDYCFLRERTVYVMGERRLDIAVRLRFADVPFTLVGGLQEVIGREPRDDIDAVANYTAFLSLLKELRGHPERDRGSHEEASRT